MKSIHEFHKYKTAQKKISVVTCYDYTSAKIVNDSDVDALLVGDSSAMVMHGFENTVFANLDMMCYHVSAVKRGLNNKLIIADLPFLEHKKGIENTFTSIDKLMKCGAQAIKIEGAIGNLETIKKITEAGIPIMGHLGLTPQSIYHLGGYKVQGKESKEAELLIQHSIELQEAGCFSIVLELIPEDLAGVITNKLEIPTIGIGAGAKTDGQVLVLQDLLGMDKDFNPKFARKYFNGYETILKALNKFNEDVKQSDFPSSSESFQ
ncbi:MAG: 3-methyl-2-oxobutanoate hydroxymethyltransferase [Stygiobacter sp.]|nr:MAG: 3-methyl-2-oxobutanoate hydroxymethyltransferase [Stygiobacter sp.]KAF0217844.1 MAG: 3-methyl-2-oxobutanoate [Ignavibacteria bacterium]